ncbi:lamin tail domain-containing protein [Chryseobacterium tongliaoense]|uniref:lamin tail domain-containing protein n=1 Tax=Chryseobacterium tongliaoense TaxID=3240933 RepID=UPI003517BC11
MKNPTDVSPFVEAEEIIAELQKQANSIFSSILKTPLSQLTITDKGNFPYYWQNPTNLAFNNKTYNWIASNLKANTTPVQLDQVFTNFYTQVLSKVVYSLSTSDTAALNTAQQNAVNQQVALLNSWKQAYGSLPPATPTMQPIDVIMNTIATQWASPKTTLSEIQVSKNLNKLLNNTPASGKVILPVLANYLNALGASVTLQNNVTMNNGYVSTALGNVQSPSADNGGLTLDNNTTVPAFQMTTQISDILNGLKNTSQAVNLAMEVSRETSDRFTVSVSGSTGFSIPILDFLTVGVSGNAKYFSDSLATSENKISVSMSFTGATLVNFGPSNYNTATGLNWAWFAPIQEAIKNGSKDVTGFKFSPNPNIDFSQNGPFGVLNGVAISNYPTIVIKVTSSNYQSIQKTFEQSSSVKVSFLGIPLASASESTYSSSTSVDSSSSTITITLNPPQDLIAGNSVDSLGWVLGAVLDYPGN